MQPHVANLPEPVACPCSMLMALLWQCCVPAPRAAWYVRVLFTHLARQKLRSLPPPPPPPLPSAGGANPASASAFSLTAPAPPALSMGLATSRASLWTEELLAHLDAVLNPSGGTDSWVGQRQGGPSGPPPLGTAAATPATQPLPPPPDYPSIASPSASSPAGDTLTLGLDDGASGPWNDPRVRMLDYNGAAAVLYFLRLAGATFMDGLLDTGRLVDWACAQMASAVQAVGGAAAAAASQQGPSVSAPAPEQLKAHVALQLLLACLPDVTQSQLHVRRIADAALELLLAAGRGGTGGSEPTTGNAASSAAAARPSGGGGWGAAAASPTPYGSAPSPPVLGSGYAAAPSPSAFGTAAANTAASTTAVGVSLAAAAGGGLDTALVSMALELLEGCAREAPAALLSLDSLPLVAKALRAAWPVSLGAASSAPPGAAGCAGTGSAPSPSSAAPGTAGVRAGTGAGGGAGAAVAAEGGGEAGPERCARRAALSERLLAAHGSLALSVNPRWAAAARGLVDMFGLYATAASG